MYRRALVLVLLVVALVLIAAPAVIAMLAIARGDADQAWNAFGPVLLVPLGFLLVGLFWSFRHGSNGRAWHLARRVGAGGTKAWRRR